SPNHTLGRTPWASSSALRVSVACSNSGILVSRHSSLPRKNGAFAPSATWTPAIAWAAFQYRGNALGLTWRWNCTLVQAASGAIDGVQRVGGQAVAAQLPLGERGQDADHQHVAAGGVGLALGVVEGVPDALFQLDCRLAGQQPGLHVDLDVELAELGLEVGVADRIEHRGVAQRRVAGLVD